MAKLETVLLDAFILVFFCYALSTDPGSSPALLCKASSRGCEPCRGIGVARGLKGVRFCSKGVDSQRA